MRVPFLYRFELAGTTDDVFAVREGLAQFWKDQETCHQPSPLQSSNPDLRACRRVCTAGETDYHALNAMLNLYGPNGEIQFDKDVLAARQYFLEHVNQNTVFLSQLRRKARLSHPGELLRA